MLLVDVGDEVAVHRAVSATVGPAVRSVFVAAVVEAAVVAQLWSGVVAVELVAAERVVLLPESTVHFVHVFVEVAMMRTVVKEAAFRDRKAEAPDCIEAGLGVFVPTGMQEDPRSHFGAVQLSEAFQAQHHQVVVAPVPACTTVVFPRTD